MIVLDGYLQAAVRGDIPSTDDAYAVGGKPIQEDIRVPMGTPARHNDASWYTMGLSTKRGFQINTQINGVMSALASYRGYTIRASVESAQMDDLKRAVLRAAAVIDKEVGGVRLMLR